MFHRLIEAMRESTATSGFEGYLRSLSARRRQRRPDGQRGPQGLPRRSQAPVVRHRIRPAAG